ncbi:hypothetical protein BVY01_00915 [bacterium I07]|nr:hypothetical protein BVY01_00915 [bacterium I07]
MNEIGMLFQKADYETRDGNFQKAINHYQRILKLSSEDIRSQHLAHWGIGDIYLNQGQYEQAEHHLSKAVKLDPGQWMYRYLLGCTYTYMEEIDKAISELEKAASLNDSESIVWGQLGWVVGHNRDIDKGIEFLKRSLSLNPSNTRSLRDICMLYAQQLMFKEALVCIEEAEKWEPENPEIERIRQDIEMFQKHLKRSSDW